MGYGDDLLITGFMQKLKKISRETNCYWKFEKTIAIIQ